MRGLGVQETNDPVTPLKAADQAANLRIQDVIKL